MDFQAVEWEDMDWIVLVLDRVSVSM